ncbi:MAG: hypothetical protein MZV70_10490 [Desulfobacterales bacterium]|nr:hypothetical protein [Desulfobacterales bacterium]
MRAAEAATQHRGPDRGHGQEGQGRLRAGGAHQRGLRQRVRQRRARSADLVAEIAAASNEQSQGIEQVNKAVAEMDKVTQQNAATAEESSGASHELTSQAEDMKRMVERPGDAGRRPTSEQAPGSRRRDARRRGCSGQDRRKQAPAQRRRRVVAGRGPRADDPPGVRRRGVQRVLIPDGPRRRTATRQGGRPARPAAFCAFLRRCSAPVPAPSFVDSPGRSGMVGPSGAKRSLRYRPANPGHHRASWEISR